VPHSKGFARRTDRRSTDPVPIGEIVDGLLGEEILARGLPLATLLERWPELVGDRLAEATTPVSLEGGVLLVRASDGPWGSQARYFVDEIRDRADELLGGGVIRSVRITVGTPDDPRNRR
jgi:hypothetical protein